MRHGTTSIGRALAGPSFQAQETEARDWKITIRDPGAKPWSYTKYCTEFEAKLDALAFAESGAVIEIEQAEQVPQAEAEIMRLAADRLRDENKAEHLQAANCEAALSLQIDRQSDLSRAVQGGANV